MNHRPARLLIVAGSDSSGGAGIQADIKTATALGVYAMAAVTAVTVQDTVRVHAIHLVPPSLVGDQIACVLADIGADAIKIGMLGSAEIAETVADILQDRARGIPLVLDPVLASTSGTSLLDARGVEVLKSRFFPLATLVTPNIPELETLALGPHAEQALDLGASAVLVKGGHAAGEDATDFLYTRDGVKAFARPRLFTNSTHGTGCTLSSAIACGLANGLSLSHAVALARDFVQGAIASTPGLGGGQGPLNHMHGLMKRH